jgi:hypothetical protein
MPLPAHSDGGRTVWVLAFPGMLRQWLLQAVLSHPRRARVVWASPAAVWAEELADRAARRRIRRRRLWPSEAAPLLAWTAEVLRSGWLQPLPADLMPLLRPSRSRSAAHRHLFHPEG